MGGRLEEGVKRFNEAGISSDTLKKELAKNSYGACIYRSGGTHHGFLNKKGECHRCARQQAPEKIETAPNVHAE